jgi:allophanate hydrolase
VLVLVIGSALRSLGVDQHALGLTFCEETRTAARYRLYAVADRYAALVEDETAGREIAGELVEIDEARFDEIVALEPPGITQGPVELADGRIVSGALGDPGLMAAEGVEITSFGGFAAYRVSLSR